MTQPDLSEFEPSLGCIVAQRLSELSDEDRLKFVAAMPRSDIKTAKIVERFFARGIRINKDSVTKHRVTCGWRPADPDATVPTACHCDD